MPSLVRNERLGSLRFGSACLRWCLVALAGLALAACASSRGGPIPYNVQLGAPDSEVVQTIEADYKLGPMDTVHVAVFQVQDLSGDFEIDLAGNIAMPLIGSVRAADLTTAQLDDAISRKLSEKYLQNPDVAVTLKASTRRTITVDGAVAHPGMFAINGPTTLIQAIAMAQGTTEAANPRRVAIFRQIQGKRSAAAFDLTSIRRGEMQDPPVYRGDIIVVDGDGVKKTTQQILQSIPILGLFNPLL
jgi:polysaccharide export outer membrane protein